jgi:hypothetical protein
VPARRSCNSTAYKRSAADRRGRQADRRGKRLEPFEPNEPCCIATREISHAAATKVNQEM